MLHVKYQTDDNTETLGFVVGCCPLVAVISNTCVCGCCTTKWRANGLLCSRNVKNFNQIPNGQPVSMRAISLQNAVAVRPQTRIFAPVSRRQPALGFSLLKTLQLEGRGQTQLRG